MAANRTIRRYAAYFRGWAQAFGEHRRLDDPENGLRWLLGEHQIGILLEPDIRRRLYAEILVRHGQEPPVVTLGAEAIGVGAGRVAFAAGAAFPKAQILRLLSASADLYLFQTYHLIYPSGTRILTLSEWAPLSILYREIPPLTLRITAFPGARDPTCGIRPRPGRCRNSDPRATVSPGPPVLPLGRRTQ